MNSSSLVLVTGTFNVLHAGHVQLLEFASRFGTVVVGINADPYLKQKYGDYAVPLNNRAYVLRSCRFVSEVVVFSEPTPTELIYRLKPDFFVRGPDYAGVKLPEQQALDDIGAKLLVHQADKIHDSSSIVAGLDPRVFDPLAI